MKIASISFVVLGSFLLTLTNLPSEVPEAKSAGTQAETSHAPQNAEANYQRARALAKGEDIPRDLDQAYSLMLESSSEGHAEATGAIGLFYQNGWAGLEKSDGEAVKWYRKGYEMGGVRAGYNLGIMLVNGLGVEANIDEGLPLIEKAADEGIPEAQLILGSYYLLGKHGKSMDYDKAFVLIKAAAELGNPHGQNTLGIMLEHGQGTKRDLEAAIVWYRKAAEANLKKAQANVALLLGINSKDPERQKEALKWLYVAAGNNEIVAIKKLREANVGASAQKLAEAKKEADDFRLKMLRLGRTAE